MSPHREFRGTTPERELAAARSALDAREAGYATAVQSLVDTATDSIDRRYTTGEAKRAAMRALVDAYSLMADPQRLGGKIAIAVEQDNGEFVNVDPVDVTDGLRKVMIALTAGRGMGDSTGRLP